jgi:predicted peptidase
VLLTGFSMGGAGTWAWGLKRPQHFAALMPVSGGFHHPEDEHEDIELTVLKSTPIWMAHGVRDTTVSVQWSDQLQASLLTHRADFGYTRYPDADHGEAAERVYCDLTMLHWLLIQKK